MLSRFYSFVSFVQSHLEDGIDTTAIEATEDLDYFELMLENAPTFLLPLDYPSNSSLQVECPQLNSPHVSDLQILLSLSYFVESDIHSFKRYESVLLTS